MRAILRTASIRLFALLALLAMAQAGFAMNNLSLVNAASYETVSVSGVATGVVAPGSIGALFSAGMASSATFAPPGVFPLPNVLAGANVTVAGIACPLMYVSATQVNLQIPFGVATGTQPVQVFSNGTLVATGNVIVADSAPGIFTYDSSGNSQAAIQNSIDYSINGNFEQYPGSRPEGTGKYLTIYLTGMGKATVPVTDGLASPGGTDAQLAKAIGTTSVTLGGVAASVSYSGLAPGYVGLWQINIVVPPSLPTNFATPLVVSLNGRDSWSGKTPTASVANAAELSTISGNVVDALTGNPLSGVDLTLTSSGKTRTVKTDSKGNYSFYVLNGSYSLSAGINGYITTSQSTTVSTGTVIRFGLTAPLGNSSQYRVVLSWTNAIDLDAHLTGPLSSSRFHVWWNGETDLQNNPITAQFNRDDTSGAGPETLTFTPGTGSYRFSVQNYTGRDIAGGNTPLTATGATVRVFKGSQQVATYTAPGGAGTLWKVFEVNNGVLTPINTITDEPDPSNIKTSN